MVPRRCRARHVKGRRQRLPPNPERGRAFSVLMTLDDRFDASAVLAASWLDDQAVCFAREECIANDRVLDQVEEVGRIAPQFHEAGRAHFCAKLSPRRATTRPVDGRIVGTQRGRYGGAHCLVYEQTVSVVLDKR